MRLSLVIRTPLLAALTLLSAAPAVAAQEVATRVSTKRHTEQQAHRDRLMSLSRELSAVRQTLAHDRELSAGERRRLQARARRLESQLAGLGAKMDADITGRVLRDMEPALADARHAMAAALAEAGIAVTRAFTPEGVRFSGWLGLTLDAPCTVEMRDGDVFWRFLEHPQIVSVDPSSPAERAGIRPGDVLLAYDGQDVRREIAMNRLLQPGRTVRVRLRVRRENNDVREVPVKIAPARDVALRQWGARLPGVVESAPRRGRERRPATAPFTMVLPDAADPVVIGAPGVTPSPLVIRRLVGLAGARMETITPGLAEAVGVDRGVLVIAVAPGVPAHESGLIDGDVILKAGGREVGTVQELRHALASSDHRSVKLDVARKGKVRQVTLRW